ncbi:MAG: hypothetical protein H6Q67_337 [Firmicutes bacterium]|nr:hypothetical protein [Bacillota bacterium]
MLTGIITFIIIVIFTVFFIIFKRNMLVKMFSLQASVPADELRQELEQTAEQIIRRLETQIAHLELLLEEADTKTDLLARQLKLAERYSLDEELLMQIASAKAETHGQKEDEKVFLEEPNLSSELRVSEQREGLGADKRQMILAMANQGYNAMEIAKATGLGKGEILLMLQLNKKSI